MVLQSAVRRYAARPLAGPARIVYSKAPPELSTSSLATEKLKQPLGFRKAWDDRYDPEQPSLRRRIYPIPYIFDHSPREGMLISNGTSLQIPVVSRGSGVISQHVSVPGRWLRDNCSCTLCRNQDTGQRQINVLKGNIDCNISKVTMSEGDEKISIIFGDGHKSDFTKSYVLGRKSLATNRKRHGITPVTTWDASIASHPPTVQAQSLKTDGLGTLLQKIRQFGFCFVEGIAATPEATESLLAAIGPIRNTHWGAFYDFTADLSSKDTAYTSEHLEPHTDNTYFTEPAGLQALHLLSHTEGTGGESSLVDGFAAAAQLYKEDMVAYLQLSSTRIYGHASGNEGLSIQPARGVPVLSHDPTKGYLTQVRWNNADRASIECSITEVEKWYDAASKFDAILSDPKNQYWFQMTPGKMVIFDNWRVLHGRAAFTGKRRMCGGYINRDDFISKYRMTNMSDSDIRASTVTG